MAPKNIYKGVKKINPFYMFGIFFIGQGCPQKSYTKLIGDHHSQNQEINLDTTKLSIGPVKSKIKGTLKLSYFHNGFNIIAAIERF